MKGLQITEWKKPYKFSTDIPVPKIETPTEILIKIAVAGYCHTEMMVQNGEFASRMKANNGLPLIPSHEATGVVVEIGSGVTRVNVGDRVASLPIKNTCGECNDCKKGLVKYCENADHNGVFANGAACEYMVADEAWTIPLPSSITFEAAAPLMCAGATIYSGLKVANLKSGQSVAIIGVGALGHLGAQFAKCMGLKVVCVDARQAPLDLVKSLKYAPDYTIDAMKGVEWALQEIGGEGVDATLMATDAIPAYSYGLQLTKKHGTFVVMGQPFDPIPIPFNQLIFRNLTVKGSLISDLESATEMVKIVAEKGKYHINIVKAAYSFFLGIEVRTKTYPLEDIKRLMQDYHKEDHAGKLVLRVSDNV
ncbi:hypothetical protein Clacol_008851 [Clathrus columnatus]|uniref:Enoyl reductase (ER) domain-containing protein n=1 Tax=Clathrus columnatus TaxID=1419009 RepID=A0AAV5AP19_9AGAM|nr:hypothetical protein Clacol_008851 [Clathrus columnatus]